MVIFMTLPPLSRPRDNLHFCKVRKLAGPSSARILPRLFSASKNAQKRPWEARGGAAWRKYLKPKRESPGGLLRPLMTHLSDGESKEAENHAKAVKENPGNLAFSDASPHPRHLPDPRHHWWSTFHWQSGLPSGRRRQPTAPARAAPGAATPAAPAAPAACGRVHVRRPEQQGEARHEKVVWIPDQKGNRDRALPQPGETTRASLHPRILLTRQ